MTYRYDSYSVTGSPFCDACHYSCLTCNSAASTACLTCNTTRDNRAFQASTSTCPCISGYFDSGTTICSSCNYTCATCTSSLACTSCNSTLGRIFNNTNCICSPGLYDNRLQQQCQTCMYSCSTCKDANSCITCPSTRYLANTTSNNQCVCLNGYYDNGISK
jgi:proprotein convertase subtilisin/kexin type 5